VEKTPVVYIVTNSFHGTLYTGVTSDLLGRIYQHRNSSLGGFTAKHGCTRLVWFEVHETMESAIRREKSIKRWLRSWKYDLIEAANPTWRDLAENFGFEPLLKRPSQEGR
jgi:putative endonuclease